MIIYLPLSSKHPQEKTICPGGSMMKMKKRNSQNQSLRLNTAAILKIKHQTRIIKISNTDSLHGVFTKL